MIIKVFKFTAVLFVLTFPGITENSDSFASELKKLKIPFYEMKPGETVSFCGKQMVKK